MHIAGSSRYDLGLGSIPQTNTIAIEFGLRAFISQSVIFGVESHRARVARCESFLANSRTRVRD